MKRISITTMLAFIIINYGLFANGDLKQLKELYENKEFVEASQISDAVSNANPKDFEAQLICGDIFLELENYDKALGFFNKAKKIKDKPEVLRRIGRVYSLQGKHDDAEKMLEGAIKDDKKDVDSYLELADAYIRANKMSEAKVQITRASNIDSKTPKTDLALGNMYFAQGVYELAKNNLLQALKKDPNLVDARVKLASSYYWLAIRESDVDVYNELFSLSLQEWNNVTKQDPNNARAFFEQGKILFWSKNYPEAATSLARFAKLRPDGALGRWFLAQSLYELNRCEDAQEHLAYASENIDTVKNKSRLLLAKCYYNSKEYDKASGLFSQLNDVAINEPEAGIKFDDADLRSWGVSTLFNGDTANAIVIFKRAVNEYPDNSCTMSNMVSRLMYASKMYEDAIFFANAFINSEACEDIEKAKALYVKGSSLLFQENYDEAKLALNAAIEKDSTQLIAYIYLADVYAKQQNIKKADSLYEYAIVLGMKDVEANKGPLNQAFARLCGDELADKNWKGLQKHAKQWSEAMPEVPFSWLYLAIGYQGAGDVDNACKYYKKVLEIDPMNSTAKNNKLSLGC